MRIAQVIKAKHLRADDELFTSEGWRKVTAVDPDAGWGSALRIGVSVGTDSEDLKLNTRVLVLR